MDHVKAGALGIPAVVGVTLLRWLTHRNSEEIWVEILMWPAVMFLASFTDSVTGTSEWIRRRLNV
ncbi:MAG: hypothetical protein NVSMB5_25550 [Candidatus Velthaea sp.]